RFRREHHHLHFSHPHALPLELHFHGYTGFRRVLPSAPLLDRWRASPLDGARALGVLEPADELVFLSIHAAAHRFVRLGCVSDLCLLVERVTDDQLEVAARRAREWGYARQTAFAGSLLTELLGVP